MKSYDVTIQMKPLQQYFHMVLFCFSAFYNWEILMNFDFGHLGLKGLRSSFHFNKSFNTCLFGGLNFFKKSLKKTRLEINLKTLHCNKLFMIVVDAVFSFLLRCQCHGF